MVLFIDTNFAIGYSIMSDKWHEKVKDFLDNYEKEIYWSNIVREEFNRKFVQITSNIKKFLNKVSLILDCINQPFLNYYEFENHILSKSKNCKLDEIKKVNIIKFFWDTKISNNYVPKLYFNEFSIDFKKEHVKMKKIFEKKVTLHDCGFSNFKKFNNFLNILKNIKIHNPDYKILLDAHDLGLKKEHVDFATTDEKLYNDISKTDFLSISTYILVN